jgi:diaminopimelate decarboxylase
MHRGARADIVRHQGPAETAPGQARRKPCRAADDGTGRSTDHPAAVVHSVFPAAGRASDRARIIRRRQAVTAFDYRDGELAAEGVALAEIAAKHGTPCFVYSRAAIEDAFATFDRAFAGLPHLVCYAMKANSNLAIVNLLARLGSGFDIVSGGELARAIAAGADPARIVFSGVGKTDAEMASALQLGILCFNLESASELEHLNRVAGSLGRRAPISFRVNPDVDPKTHRYISTGLKGDKFGIAFHDALPLYRRAAGLPHVAVRGIDMHIGSQITTLEPHCEAAAKAFDLVDRLAADGIALEHIDLGGGIGIRYRDEETIAPADYAAAIRALLGKRPLKLLFEPGRMLVGNAGALLTRVLYLKPGADRNFAIVDAAMNDLLRPALYDAWHEVRAVAPRSGPPTVWQIVGPVCESADFLAHDRVLDLAEGDLLAVLSAGAYAMAMSSNYNSRPRAAELVVDGKTAHLVRPREVAEELFAREILLP